MKIIRYEMIRYVMDVIIWMERNNRKVNVIGKIWKKI